MNNIETINNLKNGTYVIICSHNTVFIMQNHFTYIYVYIVHTVLILALYDVLPCECFVTVRLNVGVSEFY